MLFYAPAVLTLHNMERKFHKDHWITKEIEASIEGLPSESKESIGSKVSQTIYNFKNKIKQFNQHSKELYEQLNQTRKFILKNPQLTILTPDKSNTIVVMDTSDYDRKYVN